MTHQEIINLINTYIKANGQGDITGSRLNTVLNALADYFGVDSVEVTTLPAGSEATASVTDNILHLGIPKGQDGEDAVNPFKGWWPDLATLKASITATVGDSAYVKDQSPATTWSIYVYDATATTDNYWADSGRDADTSNVQTFASGEEVNETYIDDTELANPIEGSLAKAEDAMMLKTKLQDIDAVCEKDNSAEIVGYYIGYAISSYAYMGRPYQPSQDPNGKSYKVIDVSGCKSVRFLGMIYQGYAARNAGYAFYDSTNDGTQTDGTGLMAAYGYLNGGVTTEAKEYIVDVPAGAKWLFVTSRNATIQNFYCYLIYGNTVKDVIKEEITNNSMPSLLDYSNDEVGVVISVGNKWIGATRQSLGAIIPITGGKKYTIQPSDVNVTNKAVFSVLADDEIVVGQYPNYATGYNGRVALTTTDAVDVVMPDDANYLYVLVSTQDGTQLNTKIYDYVLVTDVVAKLEEKVESIDTSSSNDTQYNNVNRKFAAIFGNPLTDVNKTYVEGWEQPNKVEILNVIKKAHQLTQIKWTPLANVPKPANSGNWPANTEVTGLPYSSVKEIDKYIGLDVSLHTFMTAVNNPYSLLYTEYVYGAGTSVWGFIYHGKNNCGSYFGTVCSSLIAYATGQVVQWSTAEDAWCAKYNFNIVDKFNQSPSAINIGDIYWMSGHNRIVTGIHRDASGNIDRVKLSESSASALVGKKCSEREFPYADFATLVANDHAIFYCNIELYRNLYEKSVFVDLDGEQHIPYEYNNDICTFAGDKATFREGDMVVINYNLKGNTSGYPYIKLYKEVNGVYSLVNTYTIANIDQLELPASQRGHALKITDLDAGVYKAVLSDGANESAATFFEVLSNLVSCQNEGDVFTISFSSTNAKPISFTVCDDGGEVYAHNLFSDDAVSDGKLSINLVQFNRQQYPNRRLTSGMYLKIHFEGRYGRITNVPIQIL